MRLLGLSNDADVVSYIESHDKEIKALKEELLRMCWFMRGGIGLHEALELAPMDRQIIGDIVKSNLELAKESKMPFW
jgi:hypothetical protein